MKDKLDYIKFEQLLITEYKIITQFIIVNNNDILLIIIPMK